MFIHVHFTEGLGDENLSSSRKELLAFLCKNCVIPILFFVLSEYVNTVSHLHFSRIKSYIYIHENLQ
jgi:hypothetical protein